MIQKKCISRRNFLKKMAAAAAFPAIIPSSALGRSGHVAPSERVVVGCIGAGGQGNYVLSLMLRRPEAQVVAICDVKKPRLESTSRAIDEFYGKKVCATTMDFREIVDRKDIDAFLIASPDHWHVLHALAVARAGKDMYLEKPMGLSLAEDQALRRAVNTYGSVFQFGTQQRSDRNFRFACELARNGRLGKLHTIKVGAPPSIPSKNFPSTPVPDWIDYEMWLGPAPDAPFSEQRVTNSFWFHISDYAIGFVAGWGVHHVDIAQWGNNTDNTGPVEIEGTGIFPKDGLRDCAVAWDLTLKYANGVTMHYTDNTKNPQGVIFEGTEGWVHVKRGFIAAKPESLLKTVIKPNEVHLYESQHHAGNFLECVKTRAKTICPIETAIRSDTLCHLSDIAMRVGRKLKWDPAKETFIGDEQANRRLRRAMRGPWHL